MIPKLDLCAIIPTRVSIRRTYLTQVRGWGLLGLFFLVDLTALLTYPGDNFVRITGDAVKLAKTQLFAWEAYEKGQEIHAIVCFCHFI